LQGEQRNRFARGLRPLRGAVALLLAAVPLLALATAPRANAQQSPMEVAAGPLDDAIAHSKQKTVAVFTFSGPDNRITLLGAKLADDLSAALARYSRKIQVKDRARVEEKRKQGYYAPEIVLDPPSTLLLAQELDASAFVMGQMSVEDGNTLKIVLDAHRTDNGKGIKGLKVSVSLTAQMKELLGKDVEIATDVSKDPSGYPKGNAPGYTPPQCLYCPHADYASLALAKHVHGVVELVAVIGEDGTVKSIAVHKGLPGGLTQKAIEVVRKWKLRPALGPDGKPVAVQQIIELTFQLF
jgi:Gram-negative bacterial TonB protein C-terminal